MVSICVFFWKGFVKWCVDVVLGLGIDFFMLVKFKGIGGVCVFFNIKVSVKVFIE